MRIGFFGGSFDPPHRGHLALALAAADQFSLDKVLLAPVGVQALKQNQPVTDFPHRYAMIALAAQADPRLQPSLLDAPLHDVPQEEHPSRTKLNYSPNYTVDTLTRLHQMRQAAGEQDSFFTLLGADSFLGIRNWHQPERLLALCDWIVAARPRFEVDNALAMAAAALPAGIRVVEDRDPIHGEYLRLQHTSGARTNVWFLPHLHEDISATALRAAIQAGAWDASLVPAPVAEYIRKTGIYVATSGAGTTHRHWQAPDEPATMGTVLGDRSIPMSKSETRRMLLAATSACEEKKAEDIRVLELDPADSAFTDFFLICSGANGRQNQAIAQEIELRLKREFGVYANSVEGYRQAEWILLDYVDFVVHIFAADKRAFYDIERLRKTASSVALDEMKKSLVEKVAAVRKKAMPKKKAVAKKVPAKPPAKKAAKKPVPPVKTKKTVTKKK